MELVTRLIRSDDTERLERLFGRLSPDTIYRRFFSPIPRLSRGCLRALIDVDHDDREAIVAVADGEIVAVARYDRSWTAPAEAEVAVLVEDAWQRHGVGARVLRDLGALAWARGIDTFTASTLGDNSSAIGIARALVPSASASIESGEVILRMPLAS
jgi:GNAT superfamily N-acetyltransferase